MFPRADMVDFKSGVVGRLRHLAVFAAAFRPLPDQPRECRVHERSGVADGKLRGFKAHLMVTLTDNAVSGTCNRHLRGLKGGVVGRGERPVGGESRNTCVVKVTFDDRP
jgi:hypothetical protein